MGANYYECDSRAPYGARGLKYYTSFTDLAMFLSRPVWGAWIEMQHAELCRYRKMGRAPYGARGLKCNMQSFGGTAKWVAPRMGRVD